jgi:hypothetical protein
MVWLALRLVSTNIPTPSSNRILPVTSPTRVNRRLDFLFSFLSLFLGIEERADSESLLGTRLTISSIEINGLRILGIGIMILQKAKAKTALLKVYYTKFKLRMLHYYSGASSNPRVWMECKAQASSGLNRI